MEAGRAFLEESLDAFETVFGGIATELVLYFGFERRCEGLARIREQRLLDGANGKGRTLRDFLGKGFDFAFELRAGDDAINDAEAESGLRVDHFSCVEHFGGNGRADELREE